MPFKLEYNILDAGESRGSRRNWNIPAGSIIFFASFYLYIWLFVEPRLIYHCFGTFIPYPAFSVDWEFLKSSLSYPGGVVEYIGGFLSQLYYFSWLGALIVTAVAFLLYLAAKILVRLSAGKRLQLICYIPPVMLLIIHNRYDNQLTAFIALSAALWFTVAYEKMTVRSNVARAAVFLVMFALLYYIAGGVSFVFAVLATIYEIFAGRRRILSVLFLIIAIGAYFATRYIFVDLETEIIPLPLFGAPLGYDTRLIVISIYLFFPLALFAVGLWGWKSKVKSKKLKVKSKKSGVWRFFQNNKAAWITETALPTLILAICLFASFDGTKKKLMQVDYFASQGMWPEVLKTAHQIRPELYDDFCIHDINRALYYTGRLGDEMFRYPQHIGALALVTPFERYKPVGRIFMKRSELLLKLGHLGNAEKDAFEYMEIASSSPLVLEQLATIKLAKGQIEAAKVFWKALSKDLIFGNRGRTELANLQEDPNLASNNTVQYILSVASNTESTRLEFDDEFFSRLLDKNKNNKMAFEYMMAFYLLTKQVDKVVANISRLNDLGYERMPRYYEEAIVAYLAKHKKTDQWESMKKAEAAAKAGQGQKIEDAFITSLVSQLSGWMPRQETIERAKTAGGIYSLYRGNEQYVRKALGPDFADSYFLYYLLAVPEIKR